MIREPGDLPVMSFGRGRGVSQARVEGAIPPPPVMGGTSFMIGGFMRIPLFCFAAAVFSPALSAQETPPAESSPTGDEADAAITVTATGLATSLTNTGQAVTVIGRDEIESVQGADIARVLARAPSVSLVRNGPLGSFTGVSVRGAGADQLLVLIDGVRVADQAAPGGGFDFGTLMAGNIASVDLLRGAGSTVWGADALGGVMDISTRARAGLSTNLEYGARNTLTSTVAAGLEGERYALGLTGAALRSDGFSAAAAGREADGTRQWTLGGSAFADLTDSVELFARVRHAEGEVDIDGFPAPAFALADTAERQVTRQTSGALGANYYGQDLTLRAAFSLADTGRRNFDPAAGPAPGFTSDGSSRSVTLRGEYRAIGGLTLAFGGEQQWASYRTSFDNRESVTIAGAYVQAGWVLGRLAAHLGARLDDHARFGSEVSLGGDLSYGLGGGWRLRGSAGQGFKPPTLFQLFSDFGNPALRPERGASYDIALELGARGVGRHFALTAFRRDSADLIGFVSCFGNAAPICVGRPFGAYDNVGRARAQGIELEAGTQLAPGLRLSGAYSLIAAEDRATGRDLARRPRNLATVWADWTGPAGIALGADLRLVSASFDDRANTVRLAGYEVLDLRAAVPLGRGLELFGRVENLLDRSYQTAAGYGSPGRGVFTGVRGRM